MEGPLELPEGRLRLRHDVVSAELDGGVTVFDGAAEALVLNHSASAVWSALAEPRTVDEVVAVVAELYGEEEAVVRQPVTDLVAGLLARSLVVPA